MAPSCGCQRVTATRSGVTPAAEGVRSGVLDADGDLATDQVGRPGEVDELVATRPAGQARTVRGAFTVDVGVLLVGVLVRAWRRDGIDQHADLPAEPRLIALPVRSIPASPGAR